MKQGFVLNKSEGEKPSSVHKAKAQTAVKYSDF